ncbi:MAG: hypothetical protein M5U25_11220 [Planctomycetota bacterium]|nr:hypothetical protein [Planctomycetota bacterium]
MKKKQKPLWGLLLALALLAYAVKSNRRAKCLEVVKGVGRKQTRSYVRYKLGDDALRHFDDAEALVAERFAIRPVGFAYAGECKAEAFWRESVKNQTSDLMRKDKLAPLEDEETCTRSHPDKWTRIFDVRDAIKKLPSPKREIVELYDLYGFGYVEVADILGLSVAKTWEERQEALERLSALLRAYAS